MAMSDWQKGGQYAKHCKVLFKKQVFPRLLNPLGGTFQWLFFHWNVSRTFRSSQSPRCGSFSSPSVELDLGRKPTLSRTASSTEIPEKYGDRWVCSVSSGDSDATFGALAPVLLRSRVKEDERGVSFNCTPSLDERFVNATFGATSSLRSQFVSLGVSLFISSCCWVALALEKSISSMLWFALTVG